jgi:hypothetical protein
MPNNQRPPRKILFARVGWMRFYNGPIPDDERPIGGGGYNKSKIGHELYNFRSTDEKLFGYFQPSRFTYAVNLQRIDPEAIGKNILSNVLVVFVAPREGFGQVIVGWYRDAKVFRKHVRHSPGKPKKFGHFCSAENKNCILLPDGSRDFILPRGKGGMGQSNVCYALNSDGSPKKSRWMQEVIDFVDDYQGSNILFDPVTAAEAEIAAATEEALAQAKGQGFARTPQERKAIEDHSMAAAKKCFTTKGFIVEDVSKRRSYDLLCKRGDEIIHVEVKGTTTDGSLIVLTNNEVKHARNPDNSCVLFVLHSINLNGTKASGGKQVLVAPWSPHRALLRPINFTYRLR